MLTIIVGTMDRWVVRFRMRMIAVFDGDSGQMRCTIWMIGSMWARAALPIVFIDVFDFVRLVRSRSTKTFCLVVHLRDVLFNSIKKLSMTVSSILFPPASPLIS